MRIINQQTSRGGTTLEWVIFLGDIPMILPSYRDGSKPSITIFGGNNHPAILPMTLGTLGNRVLTQPYYQYHLYNAGPS